jgi:hypothetical protein
MLIYSIAITYESYKWEERYLWLINSINEINPDILFITQLNFNILLKLISELLRLKYYFKISKIKNRNSIDLIASKYPLQNYSYKMYSNSIKAKGIIYVETIINNKLFILANTELDKDKYDSQYVCVLNSLTPQSNESIILNIQTDKQIDNNKTWSNLNTLYYKNCDNIQCKTIIQPYTYNKCYVYTL